MPYSYVLLPGDGTTTNFNFNFGYLARDHIHVSVDTVDTPFTFLTDFSVQISPAPAAGTVIEIRRRTPLDEAIVDWTDGTVLTEFDLDLNTLFSLYAAQEAQDAVNASIKQDSEGVWDGQGRTTTNFAAPEDDTGLVTKGYFDNVYTPQLEAQVLEATTQAGNAANSASAASNSADAAEDSADAAAAILATFKGQYLGALPDAPTVDGNGDPVTVGDLYFDTTFNMMKVYSGSSWLNAGSTIEGTISIPDNPVSATAGQTVIPVPGGYDPGFILVILNGAIVGGADVDTSSGTDLEFASPLSPGDEVSWVAFGAFEVADTYTQSEADTLFVTKEDAKWFGVGIGHVIAVQAHRTGADIPPTDNPEFRFVKLTAGDAYNAGALGDEVVSGSAPLIVANAEIILAESPLVGQRVNLVNTERRVWRGGSSGVLQDDAIQNITGSVASFYRASNAVTTGALGQATFGSTPATPGTVGGSPGDNATINFDASRIVRTSTETRARNEGIEFYMRIY